MKMGAATSLAMRPSGGLQCTKRTTTTTTSTLLLTILVLFVTLELGQVQASGVFEFRLVSFINKLGRQSDSSCCRSESTAAASPGGGPPKYCAEECRTFFRVCLKHYQKHIDIHSNCTFGEYTTPVLGNNSVSSADLERSAAFRNPVRFDFDFSWPGTFSLIVEAWHQRDPSTSSASSSSSGSKGRSLIKRIAIQRWLNVQSDWSKDSSKADGSILTYSYRVTCLPNYYGAQCTRLCKARNDSYGHYECQSNGEKRCSAGWKGAYCEKAVCSPGCHAEHGECSLPNQCRCKYGWEGRNCDECQKYPGCQHGSCGKPWQCVCEEGWGGLLCNQDLNYCTNHKPCKNGGTCTNTGQGFYTCSCPSGFTGKNCETPLNNCAQHPCLNGATCQAHSATNYTCDCALGFFGAHCESSASVCTVNPCLNGGSCINGPSGYYCACPVGFQGTDCESKQTDCEPNPCSNGGTCSTGPTGYQCHCRAGFAGPNCRKNINDCASQPCLNGGTCLDDVNTFRCGCVPGFVGQLCEQDVDLCLTSPCANGGTCTNAVNEFQCTCAPGFGGKDCSENVDECASRPCLNGGRCVDGVDEYSCICRHDFSGEKCQFSRVEDEARRNGTLLQQHRMGVAITPSSMPVSQQSYGRGGGDSSSTGLSSLERDSDRGGDLSPGQLAIIWIASLTVPIMVFIAALVIWMYKKRRAQMESHQKSEEEEEARWQNEQNTLKRGESGSSGPSMKGLESGAKVIVNSLDYKLPPPLYHLNRQKSATLSKLTNEHYDNSMIYARQIAAAAGGNDLSRTGAATMSRSKSNNKLYHQQQVQQQPMPGMHPQQQHHQQQQQQQSIYQSYHHPQVQQQRNNFASAADGLSQKLNRPPSGGPLILGVIPGPQSAKSVLPEAVYGARPPPPPPPSHHEPIYAQYQELDFSSARNRYTDTDNPYGVQYVVEF